MEQKKKWIWVCIAAFVILAGVMVVKGWQKTDKEIPQKVTGVSLVSPVTGGAVSSAAVVENENIQKNHNSKQEEKSKREKVKKTTKKDETEKETEAKKSEENSKKNKVKKEGEEKNNKKKSKQVTIPTPKPEPTVQPTKEPVSKTNVVEFSIHCTEILSRKDLWKDGIEEIVPKDGIFFSGTVEFSEGETVYDMLKRICNENNIALDSVFTPLYGTYYVKGIGNLYEFDCGNESGWKYSVNGDLPGVGSSDYLVKAGDKIVFFYECVYAGGE